MLNYSVVSCWELGNDVHVKPYHEAQPDVMNAVLYGTLARKRGSFAWAHTSFVVEWKCTVGRRICAKLLHSCASFGPGSATEVSVKRNA